MPIKVKDQDIEEGVWGEGEAVPHRMQAGDLAGSTMVLNPGNPAMKLSRRVEDMYAITRAEDATEETPAGTIIELVKCAWCCSFLNKNAFSTSQLK